MSTSFVFGVFIGLLIGLVLIKAILDSLANKYKQVHKLEAK